MELGLTPQWGGVGRIPGAQLYPGTTLPLDVSLREMFSVSNIETLLFGLPATSKDMHAD